MKIRVADYIAQRCSQEGLKHVFLVTGGGAMHLNDAFARNKSLTPVCFHHEQAAAIAAESYCRATNQMAVLNVTTGPGGINALNGVFGAYVDSIAMMVISGQVKRETYLDNYEIPMRQLGDQEINIVATVKTMVKYSTVLQDPLEVRLVLDKAFFLANHGRPGPVWIDVPVDVQGSMIDPSELQGFDVSEIEKFLVDVGITENTKNELKELKKNKNFNQDFELIIDQLRKAKKPVIMVGNGIRISKSLDCFFDIASALQIPIVTGWNAHDTLANDHPLYAGHPGTVGDRAGNFAVQNADFILILGCRLNIRQISYNWKNFASKAWLCMVDADKAELDKPTLNIDHKIHADLKQFLPNFKNYLEKYTPQKHHEKYLQWCRARVDLYPTVLAEYRDQKQPVNPYYFIELLFEKLNNKDIVVAGNGSACVIGFQAAKIKDGQRFYTNSGNASMGYDLPAAIGACLAFNKQRVICLAGDGSLMMNIQELQTLIGYNLPVKVIILNNDGYHSIRQTQEAYFSDNKIGIGPEDGISFPSFIKIGAAFGIDSFRVSSVEDWNSIEIQKLMESNRPAIIEVLVDKTQGFVPKLASRKLEDGSMLSPSLEDMAPFLNEEEMIKNRYE